MYFTKYYSLPSCSYSCNAQTTYYKSYLPKNVLYNFISHTLYSFREKIIKVCWSIPPLPIFFTYDHYDDLVYILQVQHTSIECASFRKWSIKNGIGLYFGSSFSGFVRKKIWERTVAESNESAIKCRVRHATLSVTVDEQAFYITHSCFNRKFGQIRAGEIKILPFLVINIGWQ